MCADRVSRVPGRYQFSMPERPSRDGWFRIGTVDVTTTALLVGLGVLSMFLYAIGGADGPIFDMSVSYTHLRAHETVLDIVCRLLLEKKNKHQPRDHIDTAYNLRNIS